MKNLKIIACIAMLALTLYYQITSFSFYGTLFSDLNFVQNGNIFTFVQIILNLLKDALIIVLIGVFFFGSSPLMKDKAYRFLRFIVVMSVFLYLPTTIYWLFSFGQNWIVYLTLLIRFAAVVLFLIAKPEQPVKRINLANYELVAFTSAGHRFVHYLLDSLFLLPYWFILLNRKFNSYSDDSDIMLDIYLAFSTLIYCFLSEAIFGQTFGKIITGSVVVSNGPRYHS